MREAEVLARLIAAAKSAYPSAGFILNGTSRPWDLDRNDNYGSWFLDGLEAANAHFWRTIEDVFARLPRAIRSSARTVSDVSVCEEIVWGGAADFYFCHGGTMQNKIGWIHPVPGMVHSSKQFMPVWKTMSRAVAEPAPCYFVASDIIVDGDPQTYPGFGRERMDANYDFRSLDELASQFLAAARESLPGPQTGDRPLQS